MWRRTGEIFKGNREFAALVGIPYEQLREGRLAIYELMTEDSAVNFWEVSLDFIEETPRGETDGADLHLYRVLAEIRQYSL